MLEAWPLCSAIRPLPSRRSHPGLADRDGDCTAGGIDALHGAARASEADATSLAQVHWVRDGSR